MKISRREDFALILMSVLARNNQGNYMNLKTIAKDSGMSTLFLKHIANTLLEKKLIISKEGIGGGYKLVRNPKDIYLSEIVSASKHGVIIPSCMHAIKCKVKKEICNCRRLWDGVDKKIMEYLGKISLAKFAKI